MSEIDAILRFGLEVVETLDPSVAIGTSQPQFRHRNFVNYLRLNGVSVPPVTALVMSRVIFLSGQATISLLQAPMIGGPQSVHGKRLVYGYFANPATNDPATVRGQSINGYWPFGNPVQFVMQPGWKIGAFFDDTHPVASASNNTILFVGTDGQTLDVAMLFG